MDSIGTPEEGKLNEVTVGLPRWLTLRRDCEVGAREKGGTKKSVVNNGGL